MTGEAVEILLGILDAARDGFTDAELRSGVDDVGKTAPGRYATADAVADETAALALERLPLDFTTRTLRDVAELTREDLDRAYRRVATGQWTVVLVGDAATVVPALEGRVDGPVDTVALSRREPVGRHGLADRTPRSLVEQGGALVAIHFDAPPDGSPEHERGGSPVLVEARRQLAAYFAGTLRVFDLPLRPAGTEFQRRVWEVLAAVPWGTTTTYGALAARRGSRPGRPVPWELPRREPAPRRAAVPPGHRLDGALTGYAGGLERKALLLRHEGAPTEADQDALF